jgi:hypothetical protein
MYCTVHGAKYSRHGNINEGGYIYSITEAMFPHQFQAVKITFSTFFPQHYTSTYCKQKLKDEIFLSMLILRQNIFTFI